MSPVAFPPGNPQQRPEKRYALVEQVLRANIARAHLPEGLVLLEAPLAALLQTSRAPVQRALAQLERDGLVHRFAGRGYLVGPAGSPAPPLRRDMRDLGLVVSDDVDEALQARGSGEWIVADLEQSVSACLVFGTFRMVEADVAAHYRVSRTVIRDVLGRLQERGLLRKTQSSRWIAGPLTAQALRDCYALRGILEPAALLMSAATLDHTALRALRDGLDGDAGETPALLGRFVDLLMAATPNAALVAAVRQNLQVLEAATRSLAQLGLPRDDAAADLRTAIDLLLNDATGAASEWWRDRLQAACRRSVAQLKIVAVIERPQWLPSFLVPVSPDIGAPHGGDRPQPHA